MTNQPDVLNKSSLFTPSWSMIVESLLVKKKLRSLKKKMNEKPIRQSSLVVLQVLCVKLKNVWFKEMFIYNYTDQSIDHVYTKKLF